MKRKEMKRYPYIQVKTIPNAILDACLLMRLDAKQLLQLLKREPSLLRKSDLTLAQIKQKKVTKQKLIKEISEQLYGHYMVYNSVITAALSHLRGLELDHLKRRAEESFVEELEKKEWLKQQFQQDVEEGKMPFDLFVTWLRLHESFHSDIQKIVEDNGNLFEQQTGLSLPESFQFERKDPDLNVLTNQERIDLAVKVLQSIQMPTESVSYDLSTELKEEVERLQTENEQLQEQRSMYERQAKKKEKELQQTKKRLDEERGKTKDLRLDVKTQQKKIQDLFTRTEIAERERNQAMKQIVQLEAEKKEWLTQRLLWSEKEFTWKALQEEWEKERNQFLRELEQLKNEQQKLKKELQVAHSTYEQMVGMQQQNLRPQVERNEQNHSPQVINEEELDFLFSDLEENLPQPL